MPVLEAHDVTKEFREGRESVHVLHGVSLALEPGEVVGPSRVPPAPARPRSCRFSAAS